MVASGHSGEEAGELTAIREVKARHEERLLSMPGVVSVGIGKDPDGTTAIVVGLDGPRPETVSRIPGKLEGFRVRVEVVGRVRALSLTSRRNIKP
jgi:hypothetical protein